MIEFCSDVLETPQELPEQFSVLGRGAQYIAGGAYLKRLIDNFVERYEISD